MDIIEQVKTDRPIYQAYLQQKALAEKRLEALERCLILLGMEADRRDREGRDALALRATVSNIREGVLS